MICERHGSVVGMGILGVLGECYKLKMEDSRLHRR